MSLSWCVSLNPGSRLQVGINVVPVNIEPACTSPKKRLWQTGTFRNRGRIFDAGTVAESVALCRCKKECQKKAGCTAWVFKADSLLFGTCWLKGGSWWPVRHPGHVSGCV